MVKRYKKENDVSYALGATVVMELLNNRPDKARAVYVSEKSEVAAVVERARACDVPVIVGDKPFNILSPKENCFAIGEFDKYDSALAPDRNHIVLVNPSNSGNLGTIMRAALAFDCADIAVIRPAVDPFDPKTVRASMGAVFSVNTKMYDSFDDYAAEYAEREIVPFMLDGAPLSDVTFSRDKKYSLVFGNEAKGLPSEFGKYGAVRIEQSDRVDSLNLSVAASIAMYKLLIRNS